MPHPLDGCNAKLNRAELHLDTLDSKLKAFSVGDPYVFRRKRDPQTGKQIFRLAIRREPDPKRELAGIISDLAHQLRSTLDSLAWELMGYYNLPQNSSVEFPIFARRNLYWSSGRDKRLDGLPATALAIIDGVQPCNGGDWNLWTLHEVNRVDKHRAIPTVGVALSEADGEISVTGGVLVDSGITFGNPVQDGAEVGWALTDPPEADAEMHGRFRAEIAIDNVGGLMEIAPGTLVNEVVEAGKTVERLVNRFGPTMV